MRLDTVIRSLAANEGLGLEVPVFLGETPLNPICVVFRPFFSVRPTLIIYPFRSLLGPRSKDGCIFIIIIRPHLAAEESTTLGRLSSLRSITIQADVQRGGYSACRSRIEPTIVFYGGALREQESHAVVPTQGSPSSSPISLEGQNLTRTVSNQFRLDIPMQLQYVYGPLLMMILWRYTTLTDLQFVNPSAGGFSITGSRATFTETYCSPIRNVEGLPAIYLLGLYKKEDRIPTARVD
ncbi:uncharacterized protein ARMOST_21664 [Armillaria ostoyae]|uniref:Uncharacterized protein n=1 Tax=Armillaria ostoyae TaxID=47428 RepID=A0A284SAR3_ARMOS|nr:uncharacterized protein ARMOST_21664 [Armillaria ostoyae]